ncbi:predicted protein [Botrytis cinerea T4]|uniref:Uncharacterized protein n=1 Tax=Botryotinia fuckeliana (strain T4) TaxID=999810 RepID=G2YKQ3_BOTF4|nr:predicted protein [Botrytis cinerea T4]
MPSTREGGADEASSSINVWKPFNTENQSSISNYLNVSIVFKT